MKQVILKILRTGISNKTKYTVEDLENYCYIFKGLFKKSDFTNNVITCNNNKFWSYENKQKRFELIDDFKNFSKNSITAIGNTRFTILNRYESGDRYGIDV